MFKRYSLKIQTSGRSTIEITADINNLVSRSGIMTGLCHVFIEHTSASLIITENADADVRRDLEYFISKLVIDGDPNYIHNQEGDDDMAAHIRSVLTSSETTIPVSNNVLSLGTWQGLFIWEHRTHAHDRRLTITISGEQ